MSGLLNKATAVKDAEMIDAEPVKETPAADKSAGLLTSNAVPGDTFFQRASTIGLVLGAIGFVGMWFLDNYFLEDITGPIPFGLVALGLLGGSFYLVWDSLAREKTIVLVVSYLLLTSVPYMVGLELGEDSIGVAQLEINEDSNELSFVVRGSFSSATSTISLDGVDLWTEELSLSSDFVKFKAPLSEIFEGNSQNNVLDTVRSYQLTVESDSGTVQTLEITPSLMNREVTHSGAKITLITHTTTSGQTTETTEAGVQIEAIVGLFGASEQTEDNGGHSMSNVNNYLPVASDYTIQLKVLKSGSQKWQSPVITVDGITGAWTSTVSGAQVGSVDRWIALPGTDYDPETGTIEILSRDDFYDDDGCYTFEVIVTNQYHFGTSPVHTSSSSWDLSWDSEGANENMPTC